MRKQKLRCRHGKQGLLLKKINGGVDADRGENRTVVFFSNFLEFAPVLWTCRGRQYTALIALMEASSSGFKHERGKFYVNDDYSGI